MLLVLVVGGVVLGGVGFVGIKKGWFKKKAPQASATAVAHADDSSAVVKSQDTTTPPAA